MTVPPAPPAEQFNPQLFVYDPDTHYPWCVFEHVTIATVTFNRLEHTRRFFDGLLQHTHMPFDLLVVDNASEDGSVPYLREQARALPRMQVIENRSNVGLGRALLQVRDQVSDGLLVLFDNDIELLSNYWLVHLQKAFHAVRLARGTPDAALGMRLLNCEEYGFRFSSRLELLPIPAHANALPRTSFASVSKDDPQAERRLEETVVIGWTEHIMGACTCLPAAVFRNVRWEDYYPLFLGGTDTFLSGELRRLGIPLGYVENGPVARHNDWPYAADKIALYQRLTRQRAVTDTAYVRWKLRRTLANLFRW